MPACAPSDDRGLQLLANARIYSIDVLYDEELRWLREHPR